MIDIDWEKAAGGTATKLIQDGPFVYWANDKNEFWYQPNEKWSKDPRFAANSVIATRVQPERKTVKDAVKALNGTWSMDGYDFMGWNSNINRYVYGRNKWAGHEYLVCTREEFEAEVKRREGETWTHVSESGNKCKLVNKLSDGREVYENDMGCVWIPSEEGWCGVEPIKTAISLNKALTLMIAACPEEWLALLRKYDVKGFNIWTDDAAEDAA